MRRIRPWHVCSLMLLNGCADATTDDEPGDLKAFLTDTAVVTPEEGERLNAAFARQAVRAWGYRSAGVQPGDSEAWSPVTNIDANRAGPADVSAWLDAADITDQGLFAPCEDRACPRVTLSDEQRSALGARLNAPGAFRTAERLSGAALRLIGGEADVRWDAGLKVGMALHEDQRLLEINPRLLELITDSAVNGAGESLVTPSRSVASSQNSGEGSSPVPAPPEPPVTTPPLRNHEPPPGHGSNSSSDCDCSDCDLVDVKCAIEPIASGHHPDRLLSRPLLLTLTALALLFRRRARRVRVVPPSRFRAWAMRFLPIFALGLVTYPAEAQTPDSASRLSAGKGYLAAKDYASAINELEAARAGGIGRTVLEPLAMAYVGASRLPEAYAVLGELLSDEAVLKKPDRERLRLQREALGQKLAFIYVHAEPPMASILVDGHVATIDPASQLVVVSPGPHHVSVRAEGFLEAGQSVMTQATRKTVVKLSLLPSTAVAAPVAPSPPPDVALASPRQRPATPQRVYKFRTGPYVVGHVGFAILTARPSGFHYDTQLNDETKQQQENPGLTSLFGATAGMRLTRGVGIGGLLMYGRGGGAGTVEQIELTGGGGTLTHEGPADFTQQTIRLGPHFRFMAGGDVARFLAGTSLGAVYTWIDLDHVDVTASGGTLVERGTYHHDYSGVDPFWGFDLGAEFNVPSHFLLGFALDVLIERTRGVSGNPFGGTAQGYFGFSARVGFHDWQPE